MTFASAAPRVVNRILMRRVLDRMRRTLPWAAPVMLASAWLHPVLPLVLGVIWIGALSIHVWRTRPDAYEALAHWDKAAGRGEAFAAAWWFEREAKRTPLQEQHLQAQVTTLPEALPTLSQQLPLRPHRILFLIPLVILLPLAWSLRPGITEPTLSDEALNAITAETSRIAAEELEKKALTELKEEDKAALAALQQQIQDAAKKLEAEAGSATARDALTALGASARAAEKLARKLGESGQDWASAGLIAALRQHTDTADLGDATASRDAALLSKAALALAAQLRQAQLPAATLQRITDAFADAAAKAEEKDKERMVGRPVTQASAALQKRQADIAAQHLESLAMQMQDVMKREAAQKQLQNLAQQLRNAGSQSGTDKQPPGTMQAMKPVGQQGSAQQAQVNKVPQSQPGTSQAQSQLMPPGLGQGQQMQMLTQSPNGSQQQGQQSQATIGQARTGQLQKGDGQPPGNRPRLLAPVPGKPSDQQPSALLTMPGAPPNPEGGVSIPSSGRDAGSGTAELNSDPTTQTKAANSSVVDAAPSGEGPSSTRQVEGQARDEAATRTSTQEALLQIQREEEALDDSTLPPARREHIRRYFNELRKRFEP